MAKTALPKPLTAEQLRHSCHPPHFQFETTADLEPTASIIGQPRGVRAIEFGIGINSPGYNIYALGETGTGRTTAIRRFLEEHAAGRPTPGDWVYVNNFTASYTPLAIQFPPGKGSDFKADMNELLARLKEDLPKAFDTDAYEEAISEINRQFESQQETLMNALRMEAAEQGFALIGTTSGLVVAPVEEGRVMPPEEFEALPMTQRESLRATQQALNEKLYDVISQVQDLDIEVRDRVKTLNRDMGARTIAPYFNRYRQAYDKHEKVTRFLEQMHQDVLDNLEAFLVGDSKEEEIEVDFRRYEVNLLVDNNRQSGAPVVVEPNPTYHNLIGRMEYELLYGLMTTHFSNLKAGSLHRANGGYIVMNAHDLLRYPDTWAALKRAIEGAEIRLQSPDAPDRLQLLAKSLDPEPIPLSVKVILLGSPSLYYALYEQEEDFGELFKVKADFDTTMPRDDDHEMQYARFIASRCRDEDLLHFDRIAVEKVVEYGSRLAGDQNKLSTRFGDVADLIREASFWAGRREARVVQAQDVQTATEERRYRVNLLEEQMGQEINEGFIFIDTRGSMVGQVNGLTILDIGDHSFGLPSRITARSYMGEAGVVNIEREVELAGPIHNKGMLILTGYLGGTYAQDQPFSLSASLTFEQNYSSIDGDSASSAELYALLSSLSEAPLKQGVAASGSINQRGEVQPIGGVTEKIEGFFDVCLTQGLTGEQGVLIPTANVRNLMLREDIVEACAAGRFHVWAIATVDEGIELLTGVPAGKPDESGSYPEGTIHYAVQKRLLALAHDLKRFGDDKGD